MHRAFETSEEGLQYCEEQFLTVGESHGLCSTDGDGMSLTEILQLHSPVCLTCPHRYLHLEVLCGGLARMFVLDASGMRGCVEHAEVSQLPAMAEASHGSTRCKLCSSWMPVAWRLLMQLQE